MRFGLLVSGGLFTQRRTKSLQKQKSLGTSTLQTGTTGLVGKRFGWLKWMDTLTAGVIESLFPKRQLTEEKFYLVVSTQVVVL